MCVAFSRVYVYAYVCVCVCVCVCILSSYSRYPKQGGAIVDAEQYLGAANGLLKTPTVTRKKPAPESTKDNSGAAASTAAATSADSRVKWIKFVGYDGAPGNDLKYIASQQHATRADASDCKTQCAAMAACTGFAKMGFACYLKSLPTLGKTKVAKEGVTLYVIKGRGDLSAAGKPATESAATYASASTRAAPAAPHVVEVGGKQEMGSSPLPKVPSGFPPESEWTVELRVALSLRLMERPKHKDRIRHLIGPKFDVWKLDNGDHPCFDNGRDFRTDGVVMTDAVAARGRSPAKQEGCDIDCSYVTGSARDSSPPCERKTSFSMENVAVRKTNPFDISGNTAFTSVVPLPYGDWFAFGFNEELEWPKTADALAAAYISNCGFNKRNQMVENLQKHGVSVFSYGNCVHNRNEDQEPRRAKASQRGARKINNLKRFRFSLAFENSETDDYITEKFFGSLVAGTIPVVIGAPNAWMFAPSEHSFIYADDYGNAEGLAKHLKYLASNDTAWLEYLSWKRNGYSDDFKAIIDTATVHGLCRRCIMVGDQTHRFRVPTPNRKHEVTGAGDAKKTVFIRERGNFYYDQVDLKGTGVSFEGLLRGILANMKPKERNRYKNNDPPKRPVRVYTVYTVGYRDIVDSDDALNEIPDNSKLEFILV